MKSILVLPTSPRRPKRARVSLSLAHKSFYQTYTNLLSNLHKSFYKTYTNLFINANKYFNQTHTDLFIKPKQIFFLQTHTNLFVKSNDYFFFQFTEINLSNLPKSFLFIKLIHIFQIISYRHA